MPHGLYSIDQVAERLGLHVRTVRNYVRSGRLKGLRVGRQYRIPADALDAFVGHSTGGAADPVARSRHVEISSVVQIDAIGAQEMNRVANHVIGAAKTPRLGDAPLRIETVYDAERARLKVIIVASLESTEAVLRLIAVALGG